ncbi:hypothetical protein GALLN_00377 [Gallionellaceae bacterium]|nr:hypothetical protein GALLN_00377 [Gallionellaceae bacterium]
MYLEHFGLNEPPFKITPATDFFFSGDNRGEILDALIYAIAESEGIIKITGEVGSGKTMLCRMLLERLPLQMETIYLANPSLSREEMLYAIADGLGLNLEGQRVNVIMQTLQNLLAQKSTEGKRIVVLVDEAHAMPLDTLEELRLLYNLQLGNSKLLQIVLFGQPELNSKLDQPNMRQLKDRIVHHFNMMPLSRKVVISYLLFRLRAAGYRGPNIFSPAAVKLIGAASNGLMRRVNILADKALLAAFIENTHHIEARHVKAAIRDSELSPRRLWDKRKTVVASAIALFAMLLVGTGWFFGGKSSDKLDAQKPGNTETKHIAALPSARAPTPAPVAAPVPAPAKAIAPTVNAVAATKPGSQPTLLQQRLSATQDLLAKRDSNSASIMLFQTTETQLKGFLTRADDLGKLGEIYVIPARTNGKHGFRVLYGAYPNIDAARAAMAQLPQRYQDAFIPEPYLLDGTQ